MKKRIVVIVLAILLLGSAITYATIAQNEGFLAGEYFRIAKSAENTTDINLSSSANVVAEYGNHKILRSTLDYYKNLNSMGDTTITQNAQTSSASDMEIINQLITNIILAEEAARLGLSATEAEINEMLQANMQVYEMPEGKEFIDSYCRGAGISVDEYFALIREQLPDTIARQKLKDSLGKAYCEKHGLVFTKVNPPEEMLQYVDQYIDNLFATHENEIIYHLTTDEIQ